MARHTWIEFTKIGHICGKCGTYVTPSNLMADEDMSPCEEREWLRATPLRIKIAEKMCNAIPANTPNLTQHMIITTLLALRVNTTVDFLQYLQAQFLADLAAVPSNHEKSLDDFKYSELKEIADKIKLTVDQRVTLDDIRTLSIADLRGCGFVHKQHDEVWIPSWIYCFLADGEELIHVRGLEPHIVGASSLASVAEGNGCLDLVFTYRGARVL